MKASFRQLALIGVFLCGNALGQTYTVKPGDSLSKIARAQGCTVEALAKANGIKLSATIQAGQTLKLPGSASSARTRPSSTSGGHTVQSGDTLSSISRQYNVSVETLLAANPGLNPKALKPGQKLQLAATGKSGPNKAKVSDTTPPKPAAENPEPKPKEETPAASPAASETKEPSGNPAPLAEEKVRTVVVDGEMTFGEFAAQHGADVQRLNQLNGLDLTSATVLAKGSELYVPAPRPAESQR